MFILLLKKLLTEEQFDELAYLYVHEQEVINQKILEKWLKDWVEKYEKDEQTRSLFNREIIAFLDNKKFELQEIEKLKQKLNILGFKKGD
nr:hypothetical protein [Sulfurospirillum sp. 'SP']